MDILCFSSSDWDGVWGSRQQVMLRFAQRGYRVLYIERQAGVEHLLRYPDLRQRKRRRWREGLRAIRDGLWIISPPVLLPGRYYSKAINWINQWIVYRWTLGHLRDTALVSPILWLYKPEQGNLVGRFGERLSVYHCIDEFTVGTRGHKRRTLVDLESRLLQSVDIVFANSRLTYEGKRRLQPNTYRIPSGADVQHFARTMDPDLPLHPAVAQIPRPIAGFIGNIARRIDLALLESVASQMSGWHFVFVGGYYTHIVDLSRLMNLANVHFLGKRPFADLPSLAKGIDVFMLPYVRGERALHRSPLKLYEYLAAGRPIVSTPQPEVQEFSDVVYLAETADEFAHQLETALRMDTAEQQRRRLGVAEQNSWDVRVDEMERVIHKFLEDDHG